MNQNDLPEAGEYVPPPHPRRPVVPLRDRSLDPSIFPQPPKPARPHNPFSAVQEANKASEELHTRLNNLAEKLTGEVPEFTRPAPDPKDGLLPLSAAVANLIAERSRHGVSLVDKIEEFLG